MIGLLIVTHGKLGVELRAALEHVVGPQRQIRIISIMPDDKIEECREMIMRAIETIDGGKGVLIVTDLFGGTPSNLAIAASARSQVEVLAGANLPMLVKFAEIRETAKLKNAAEAAQAAGRKYIQVASNLLK